MRDAEYVHCAHHSTLLIVPGEPIDALHRSRDFFSQAVMPLGVFGNEELER